MLQFCMKMKAQTIWFIFGFIFFHRFGLSLPENLFAEPARFTLEDSSLTATEGSCAEIKCHVKRPVFERNFTWFWMKDAIWHAKNQSFTASIIYTSHISSHTVIGDYATRVKYIGSSSSTWNDLKVPHRCSILICNLKKADSGIYQFRFEGNTKWATEKMNLSVTENICPITLVKQPVIKESTTLDLLCSTLTSCPSSLLISGVKITGKRIIQDNQKNIKTTVASITASWNDDGKEISCQTENNQDPYLIQRINLTVEYAPKNVNTTVSSSDVSEGQALTFSCSARGRPYPTFQWFHNGLLVSTQAQWTIPSITYSEAGNFSCTALNKHGTAKSLPRQINVFVQPQVEVQKNSSADVFKEGDALSFFCHVKKSNPLPQSYSWYKDGKNIGSFQSMFLKYLQPDDAGSYTCEAKNNVGIGQSLPVQISVQYSPRSTNISLSADVNVKVGQPLTLFCVTDANPVPGSYSWYRDNDTNEADLRLPFTDTLSFREIQRADGACYLCSATNAIGTGEKSQPVCILVHYPPTNLKLSMVTEVTEDELITITCTVESFPRAQLTLAKTTTPDSSVDWFFQSPRNQQLNKLRYEVKATAAHAGFYECTANNTEGFQWTRQKLAVKYAPKNVTVQSKSGLSVGENMSLTLHCIAKSHPEVYLFRWMKMIDGKSEIIRNGQTITLDSVSPSDSGFYSCAATNDIGTGSSQQVAVKVKYAPKDTKIRMSAEMQQDDGRSYVTLTCSTDCYPPVERFSWYKQAKGQERDVKLSESMIFRVFSDQPGIYYCTAKNEINEIKSGPVTLFVGGGFVKLLLAFLIILPVIALVVFAYRSRIKRSFEQKKNTWFALPNDGNRAMRRMNQPVNAHPSWSRDDLLPDQLGITEAQQCQNHPDSIFNSIYSQLNLHNAVMTPSAESPVRQTVDDSLNYAALQFGKKKKHEKAKEEKDVVYAIVSRKKSLEKDKGGLEDYENFSAALPVRTPNPLYDDMAETSEDETELCYTQVHFTAKPGCQQASITCDGKETQYSEVQFS